MIGVHTQAVTYNSNLALQLKNQILLKMIKTWFLTRKANFELYRLGVHTHHKPFFFKFSKSLKNLEYFAYLHQGDSHFGSEDMLASNRVKIGVIPQ